MVGEERMMPVDEAGDGVVLFVRFTASTLMVEWQEGHPARKDPCSTYPRRRT